MQIQWAFKAICGRICWRGTVYKKRYQSWRKHFDFLLLDLFCLHLSYFFSYLIIFYGQNPYGNTFYNNALFVVTLIDGAVIVFYQTFRNVIQRDLFKEISITVKHSIIVALLSIISIYITDTTNYYNRYLLLLMFVFYVVITFIVRCLWKLFLTKRATNGGKRKLFIVTTESMMETVLDNIRNKNYQRYNIVGISVIDKDLKGEYIDGVKIVANSDDVYEFVCKNQVDEVFINLDQEQPYPTYRVDMFEEMEHIIMETIILYMYHIQIRVTEPVQAPATEDHLKGSTAHYVDDNTNESVAENNIDH